MSISLYCGTAHQLYVCGQLQFCLVQHTTKRHYNNSDCKCTCWSLNSRCQLRSCMMFSVASMKFMFKTNYVSGYLQTADLTSVDSLQANNQHDFAGYTNTSTNCRVNLLQLSRGRMCTRRLLGSIRSTRGTCCGDRLSWCKLVSI